jgi:hypothetical protein
LIDATLVEGMNEGAANETSCTSDKDARLGMKKGIGGVNFLFPVITRQSRAKWTMGGFEGWVVFSHGI